MNKFDVVIVAAGTSQRFKKNKLDEVLSNGKTVLETTISKFIDIELIDKIIIVTNNDKATIIDIRYKDKILFCNGGATRAESVSKGILLSDTEYVLIHDGARPFISKELIVKLMEETSQEIDMVIPILKISDSLKCIKNGIVSVNRDDYVLTQTPQIIRRKIFLELLKKQKEQNWQDELELFLEYYSDNRIKLVNGNVANKKITYPEDL